jgi:peroxiredoxin
VACASNSGAWSSAHHPEHELKKLFLLVPIVSAIALGCGGSAESVPVATTATSSVAPVAEGTVAPDFTLPLLGGGEASLSDYRGKVVVLNITASWCNGCRDELRSLQALGGQMEGLPLAILASSVDLRTDEDLTPFVAALKIEYPVLLDTDKKVYSRYQVEGIPETLVIDKNGVVKLRVIGSTRWDDPASDEYQLIQYLLNNN